MISYLGYCRVRLLRENRASKSPRYLEATKIDKAASAQNMLKLLKCECFDLVYVAFPCIVANMTFWLGMQ